MSAAPRLSVVIPHWNGRHHLDDCLNALRRQTFNDHEVIVADNGSTDGSQAYLRDAFPEVRLVELGQTGRATTYHHQGRLLQTHRQWLVRLISCPS